jgi:hypothetical protein
MCGCLPLRALRFRSAGSWKWRAARLALQGRQLPRRLDRVNASCGATDAGMTWSAHVLMVVQPGRRSQQIGSALTTSAARMRQRWVPLKLFSQLAEQSGGGRGGVGISGLPDWVPRAAQERNHDEDTVPHGGIC